jgi:hypothetical protein
MTAKAKRTVVTKRVAFAAGCATLLSAPLAFPCGAPFGSGVQADPQQDIIVVHKAGIETYVFQPRFCGAAKDFGLILPIPSKLSEQPALSEQVAFSTVDTISRPSVTEQTVCAGSRGGGPGTGGANGADAGTSVVTTGRVGFMDYAQLKADTVQSFTDWLTSNGYPYGSTASSIFAYYVEKGWYFVAFRISQSAGLPDGGSTRDGGASSGCNALGPVRLSFASDVPVVPSRMANAGAIKSGQSSFAWRIFGVTPGDVQLGFKDGANTYRKLSFSGVLTAAEATNLAGLAQTGDRLSKLTVTFDYGSTDPDVNLSLVAGENFREYQTVYRTINCDAGREAGLDTLPIVDSSSEPGRDLGADVVARPETSSPPDAGTDKGTTVVSDAGTPTGADSGVPLLPDAGLANDSAPPVASPDAWVAMPDAGTHAYPDPVPPQPRGGGCSVSGTSPAGDWILCALLIVGLACRACAGGGRRERDRRVTR